MKKRIAIFFAVIVSLLGFTAIPAQAAWVDCPDNNFCIWTSTQATGSRYQFSYDTFVDSYRNGIRLGSGISNRGYSFYNRIHGSVVIFDDYHCLKYPWYRTMTNNRYASAEGSDWGGRVSSLQLGTAVPTGGSSLQC